MEMHSPERQMTYYILYAIGQLVENKILQHFLVSHLTVIVMLLKKTRIFSYYVIKCSKGLLAYVVIANWSNTIV